jgi:hypothetical protein
MVKNIVGGKKGKMMANKNGGRGGGAGGGREQIRMIEFPDIELMVCVTKVFGGGLFEVMDNSGEKYRAFLRGKMKGHNKRHNLVSLFSILLVAKRIDTDVTKCDILFVYDAHDIQFLALNPMLNISNLLSLHNNHILSHTDTDDLFLDIDQHNHNHNRGNGNGGGDDGNGNGNGNGGATDSHTDFDFNAI